MSSHVSLTTRDGGGRLASGAAQSSSQIPTIAATASNGGNRFSRWRFAAAEKRDGAATARAGLRASPALEAFADTAKATTFGASARGSDRAVELIASARALDREACEIRLGIRGVEHLAVEERLDAARRRPRDLRRRHAELLRGLAPQVLAIDLRHEPRQVVVAVELAPTHTLDEEPELVAPVWIRRVVVPELHRVRTILDDLARAVVEPALQTRQDVGHGAIEPLPPRDDLRELDAVRGHVAPPLRILHGHQERLRGVRVRIDPVRAHRKALLGMLVPDLRRVDGRVADLLILQLLVPRLADAEAIHGADLHVGHHLRRRHDDRLDVLVGIDAARGEPVADPAVVRSARERHRGLDGLTRRLFLFQRDLERRRVEAELQIGVLVRDGDALTIEIQPSQ